MAKITAYPEDTTPTDSDKLILVDNETGSNRKVSKSNLFNSSSPVGANGVATASVQDDAITPAKWTNPYCFGAYASSTTTLVDATWTKVNFATEEYDYNNNFASSTYTAPVAGIYHFDGTWTVGTVATGVLGVAGVYKNGLNAKSGGRATVVSNGAASVSCNLLLAAGDTIEFWGYQDSAGNENVTLTQAETWFSGHLVHAI